MGFASSDRLCNPKIDGTWKNFVTDFGAPTDGVSDSTPASLRWQAWAVANDGSKLYIPPGHYVLDLNGQKLSQGCNNVTISGYDASVTRILLGSLSLLREDYTHSARFRTTAAGATSLTLMTGAEISRFSVGQWILVSGLSLMTYGYPPSFQYNEYRQITEIVGATISWLAPLAYEYLSTWPEADPTHAIALDIGGPATVYAMDRAFGGTKTFLGLRVTEPAYQVTCSGGESTVVCGMYFDGNGPAPSMAKSFVIKNSYIGTDNEVDKAVEYVEYNNCTGSFISFQSASIMNLAIKRSNITTISGTAQNTTIEGSTIGTLRVGPTGYGHGLSLAATNSTINTATLGANAIDATLLSFSNGTFSVPLANRDGMLALSVPGQKYFFAYYDGAVHSRADGTGLVTSFTVTAVRQDANATYIDTDLGSTLPKPTFQGGQPANRYQAYAAATITQTNSGPADLTQWAAPLKVAAPASS